MLQTNEPQKNIKSYSMLKDSNGNYSSKRIAGFILLSIGAFFLLTIGIISIFRYIVDSDTALTVGKTIISVGGGLLGIGVVEFLGGKK